MKKDRIKIFATLLGLMCSIISYCQEQELSITPLSDNLVPEHPNSWKMRNATLPAPSLLTGAVIFEIPLYTLQFHDLTIPFTLTYRSNGIKVTDDPYPCGYGWALLPSLRISRTIKGRADEYFPFYREKGSQCNVPQLDYRCMTHIGAEDINHYTPDKCYDAEHDIFTIMLPDKVLTVYYEDGKFIGVNCNEYSITTKAAGKIKFANIIVTDPLGYKYLFTNKGAYYRDELQRTEWLLQNIEAPSGDLLGFGWEDLNHKFNQKYPTSTTAWYYDYPYNGNDTPNSGWDRNTTGTDMNYQGIKELASVICDKCHISLEYNYSNNTGPQLKKFKVTQVRI